MLSSLAIANKALDEDDLFIVTGGVQYENLDLSALHQNITTDQINNAVSGLENLTNHAPGSITVEDRDPFF